MPGFMFVVHTVMELNTRVMEKKYDKVIQLQNIGQGKKMTLK